MWRIARAVVPHTRSALLPSSASSCRCARLFATQTPTPPPPTPARKPDASTAKSASPSSESSSVEGAYRVSPPSDFLSGISSLINASRTSTTKILWQMRKQEREDMDSHLAIRKGARSPITPVEGTTSGSASLEAHAGASASGDGAANVPLRIKTKPSNPFPPILPFDSFWSVSLPFDTDLALYDDYVRFDGGVRFERILEDLDAFAGNVAHLHVKKGVEKMAEMYPEKVGGLPDMSIVTASVDNITMNPSHRFPMDQHLAMQGCVTWVGSSSMEIWIEMRLIRDPVAWSNLTLAEKLARSTLEQDDVIFNSFFLMAARDQKSGKATFVPPLNVAEMGKSDRERFERGEKSATRRKTEAANSLTRIPPTAEEVKLIHHYIMDAHPDASGGGSGSAAAGVAGSAGNAASGLANLEISSAPPSLLTPGAVIIRPKTVPMAETEMSSATMTQPQDRNTNGKIFGGFLMRNAYELARCTSYLFCNSNPYLTQVGSISFLRPVEIGSIISFRSKICYAAGHPDPAFQVVPLTYREAVDFLDGRRRREKLAEAFGQTPQRWKVMEGGGLQAEPTSAAPKPPAPDIVDLGAPTGAGP